MKKPDLFLEEAVLDDLSKSFDSLEMPVSERVFNAVIVFASLVCLTVIFRVSSINLFKGEFYKNRALANMSQITVMPAERGLFFDRFGKPIVENTQTFKAVLKLDVFFKKDKSEQDKLISQLSEDLGLNLEEFQKRMAKINLEQESSIIIKRDISIEEIAKLKNFYFKIIDIQKDFSRQYDKEGIFSHILGYAGFASLDELKNYKEVGVNDLVGKAGLELFYDKELRGKNGEIIDFRNAKNESIETKTVSAQTKGNDLYLNIDADFQKYFYRRLKQQIDGLNRSGGVGIAVNPSNGEVLALISLPSFDNNKITSQLLVDKSKPLFNRAVSGVYNPGSTIKPLVGVASLKENILSPVAEIYSPGYIDVPNPYNPDQPSRFLDWRPQGWVNLYSAIARSSNVYFYEVGGGFENIKGLGIKKLREYWQKFGLEEKTGIDLPGEKSGFLPDIEEKEKRTGAQWRLGDTYNVSIGQGDLMITPLELVNFIASIANKGKAYQPRVVSEIGSGDINRKIEPKIIFDNAFLIEEIKEVEKGMIDAVKKPYGTAHLLDSLEFGVAAKTGSAQIEMNTKVNAFFVGYGPIEKDVALSLVILVLIENAREGSLNAVPVAKDVFEWYYKNRIMNKE